MYLACILVAILYSLRTCNSPHINGYAYIHSLYIHVLTFPLSSTPRYDDIVVGAPMYSRIGPDVLEVEIGRVYIFINTEVRQHYLPLYSCLQLQQSFHTHTHTLFLSLSYTHTYTHTLTHTLTHTHTHREKCPQSR